MNECCGGRQISEISKQLHFTFIQSFFQPIFEGDYHPLPENFDILDTFFKFLDTFFKFLDTFFKFWTLVSSFWTQFSSFDSHFLNTCHLAVAPKS